MSDSAPASRARPKSSVADGRTRRDPEGMRRKIIEAATGEFARHGYGSARIERISARARTVDRMLYYYFGSKEGLFRAVLEKSYEDLGHAEQALNLRDAPPLEGMKELVAFTWNYYLEHPEFIRILNSENSQRGVHLRRAQRVSALAFPLLTILKNLLDRGAKEGVFRKDADPLQIYITIAALGYFYLSNRYTLSRFLDTELMSEKALNDRQAHIQEVVLAYLCSARKDT
ncbi:MAG: TetR family transcriptional regulator [Burkholderiales bacterium]